MTWEPKNKLDDEDVDVSDDDDKDRDDEKGIRFICTQYAKDVSIHVRPSISPGSFFSKMVPFFNFYG